MSESLKATIAWEFLRQIGRPTHETTLQARAIGSRWKVRIYRPLGNSEGAARFSWASALSDGDRVRNRRRLGDYDRRVWNDPDAT
jgi:hypothetical protein